MAGPTGPSSGQPGGLLQSLQRLAATVLETAQLRLEIFGNDIAQEKLRIFDALAWAAIGLLLLVVGLLLGAALLVLLAPEAWRLLVLGLMALACLALGAGLLLQARQRLLSPGGPLAASRAELARDRAALGGPPPG